ncbi:MAG TPA: hypothetical protein VN038_25525 [Dyadobacter sp.]|nr:hypothetical protein [Dyadobacter sp.]
MLIALKNADAKVILSTVPDIIDFPYFHLVTPSQTDNIQPLRPIGSPHFSGTGLPDLGDAWYNELSSGNFTANPSIQANTFPQLNVSANGGNHNYYRR